MVANLLKEILSDKFKEMPTQKLLDMHQEMTNGKLHFWKTILNRMYDQESWEYITERVLESIYKNKNKKFSHQDSKMYFLFYCNV